ncbi:Glycoside hydrolase family 47 [Penicillium hispanicum]|uniref:Glycoside hydrolase family 47 n=1 Tax=Penicillium hispanicum TaxID=1080232 RepID=UPI00254161F2|nr:Glycoside hydrolase family 47 [Penicillium hispanicum]KAJ5570531.1 Glycoside hydrolase family 47 [Penicillium hispanicum]
MLRVRRYRVLIIFAAAFLFTFLHFSRSRDWDNTGVESSSGIVLSPPAAPTPPASNARPDSKPDVPHSDGGRVAPAVPDYSSHGSGSSLDKINPIGVPGAAPKEDGKTTSQTFSNDKPGSNPGKIGGGDDAKSTDTNNAKPSPSPSPSLSPGADPSDSIVSQNDPSVMVEEIDPGGGGRAESSSRHSGTVTRWKKFPERFPVPADKLIKLPSDPSKPIPKMQAKFKDESMTEKQERLQQLSTVKAEFRRAWNGYIKGAMGHDELKPLSGRYGDPFNGWGATLVDALDTLWIMDLKQEFSEAVDAVQKIDFTTSARDTIPVFETAIRYLGGLLGAYDVSGQRYPALLEKAQELAEILIGAFDTPNRMPVLYYRWAPERVNRPHRASKGASLAEIGSLSLEFTRLAQLTKKDKYYDAIARITNDLEKLQDSSDIPGLWPIRLNAQGCAKRQSVRELAPSARGESPQDQTPTIKEPPTNSLTPRSAAVPTDLESYLKSVSRDTLVDSVQTKSTTEDKNEKCDGGLMLPVSPRDNKYTMGALADSAYEYLPKEHLLLGGVTDQYRSMYKKAIDAARSRLLFRPMIKDERDIRFMASTASNPSTLNYEGAHLTCFVGGMVAVGAKAFGIEADMDLAHKLTDGCVWAYEITNTGIMPENFQVMPCSKERSCEWDDARYEEAMKRYDNPGGIGSVSYSRTSDDYDQRVKPRTDGNQTQESNENSKTVPLTMPGSLNPHDNDPLSKRDAVSAGRDDTSNNPAVPRPSLSSSALASDNMENRDAPPRLSRQPGVQPERNSRPPVGMTSVSSPEYLLRPEAIESVFIMFRLTGDYYWRRKGWKMFEAISKYTRTDLANAVINDVTSQRPMQKDTMESFWLAETLKYFYLLFSDPSVVDLDKFVLNTEAHPFQRPT